MKYYIFADESNTDKARYMLIGGIWVDEITLKIEDITGITTTWAHPIRLLAVYKVIR